MAPHSLEMGSLLLNSPLQLIRLATGLQASFCLCAPRNPPDKGVIGTCDHIVLSYVVAGDSNFIPVPELPRHKPALTALFNLFKDEARVIALKPSPCFYSIAIGSHILPHESVSGNNSLFLSVFVLVLLSLFVIFTHNMII